jgi:hypothetical protein
MVATVPSESEETLCMLNLSKSYGYEVRNASWRAQFVGKSAAPPLQSNGDIWKRRRSHTDRRVKRVQRQKN